MPELLALCDKAATICPPVVPIQHDSRPINIVSYEFIVAHREELRSCRFAFQPRPTDPIFAFTWLDNVILNQLSHAEALSIERAREARFSLNTIAILASGRPLRPRVTHPGEGLFPNHLFEDGSEMMEFEHLCCVAPVEDKELAVARAWRYRRLAGALRSKYGRERPVRLVLSRNEGDGDVKKAWESMQLSSTFPVGSYNRWQEVNEFVFPDLSSKQAARGAVPWTQVALNQYRAGPLDTPFSIGFDTNIISRPVDRSTTAREGKLDYINDFLKYAKISEPREGDCAARGLVIPHKVLEETTEGVGWTDDGARVVKFIERWAKQPGVSIATAEKPPPTSDASQIATGRWRPGVSKDALIRLQLRQHQQSKGHPVLFITGDGGMTTALWHLNMPVMYKAQKGWHLPDNATDMITLFNAAAHSYHAIRTCPPPFVKEGSSTPARPLATPQGASASTSQGRPPPAQGRPQATHGRLPASSVRPQQRPDGRLQPRPPGPGRPSHSQPPQSLGTGGRPSQAQAGQHPVRPHPSQQSTPGGTSQRPPAFNPAPQQPTASHHPASGHHGGHLTHPGFGVPHPPYPAAQWPPGHHGGHWSTSDMAGSQQWPHAPHHPHMVAPQPYDTGFGPPYGGGFQPSPYQQSFATQYPGYGHPLYGQPAHTQGYAYLQHQAAYGMHPQQGYGTHPQQGHGTHQPGFPSPPPSPGQYGAPFGGHQGGTPWHGAGDPNAMDVDPTSQHGAAHGQYGQQPRAE